MKIAIYLGDAKGPAIDARCVEDGNPGVGGTQFCMLQLAHYLKRNSSIQVVIISGREYLLEDGLILKLVSGDSQVCLQAENEGVDIIIMKVPTDRSFQDSIRKSSLKVITWAHNFITKEGTAFICNTPQICANVFVGKEMYDRYIDDDVINKSTYIVNMYTDNTPHVQRENDNKTVVYMGALIPEKGFGRLASIWPDIKKQVPDARLLVLGSGRLYGDSALGKYGLAEKSFEDSFIKYLLDSTGKIDSSVHFLGVVGKGKTEIFRKCSVGVVNPSGRTETFGMGVVEMAEAKLPVSTIRYGGYIDTVINNKTGYTSRTLSGVKDKIVYLLKNPHVNNQMGEAAKSMITKYRPELIGKQWMSLLDEVEGASFIPPCYDVSAPYDSHFKYLRIINRFLRFNCKCSFLPSILYYEYFFRDCLKNFLKYIR